jgi:actin-like ATPase involved in cell morphogenesis
LNSAKTNIRVGPGVYLALKKMSDNSCMSMGALTNFFVVSSLTTNWNQIMTNLPPELQTALVSDFMSVLGDVFKMIGLDAIKKTSIADIYQKMLNPEKNPLVS